MAGWDLLQSLCSLVSSVALIQLIRIELRVPEYGRTTQKVFHLMNFIVNGGADFCWIFLGYSFSQLIHFSYYFGQRFITKLEVCQQINSGYIVYIWVNLGVHDNSVFEFIGKIFIAVVSFIAAVGFLFYGGRLFFMLRRFPIESKGRRKKLHEVGFVTAICFTCFLIRCFVVVLSAFDADASLDVFDHPLLNLIYYTWLRIFLQLICSTFFASYLPKEYQHNIILSVSCFAFKWLMVFLISPCCGWKVSLVSCKKAEGA